MAYPGSLSDLSTETEGFKCDDWEGCAVVDDDFYFNLYNSSLDPGESQKDLTWPNQELNQSCQSSENQWNYQSQEGLASTKAGTGDSGSKKGSKNPSVTHQLRISGKAQESNERKKEIDKRYREKCRESKKKMEYELDQLRIENANLHDENKKLMMEKEFINKSLELAITETNQLNAEIRNLRSNTTNQQIFVDSFLKKLDDLSNNGNHQLELKKLQNEIMVLKQNNWDDWLMSKAQLEREIASLDHENKILRIQVDALCEKIHNDLDAVQAKT